MSSIYNFHQVSDRLACSGQPSEGQLQSIADEGYEVVVNLGLADGKYALADEAASVKNLGLAYYHLPTQFESPQVDELAEFIGVMNNHADEKTLVHCAANYRASVFTGLYLFYFFIYYVNSVSLGSNFQTSYKILVNDYLMLRICI